MIQGLGTLKLLTDIDQDKVLEGFEFIGVEYSEKSNDGERFYKRINKESKNEEMPKKILNNYFKKLLNLVCLFQYQLSIICVLNACLLFFKA